MRQIDGPPELQNVCIEDYCFSKRGTTVKWLARINVIVTRKRGNRITLIMETFCSINKSSVVSLYLNSLRLRYTTYLDTSQRVLPCLKRLSVFGPHLTTSRRSPYRSPYRSPGPLRHGGLDVDGQFLAADAPPRGEGIRPLLDAKSSWDGGRLLPCYSSSHIRMASHCYAG